jgi:hypothetical protein
MLPILFTQPEVISNMTNITRSTALKASFSVLGDLDAATAFNPNAFVQVMEGIKVVRGAWYA